MNLSRLHLYRSNIRHFLRLRRAATCALVLFLLAQLPARAQDTKRLPDSVGTSEEALPFVDSSREKTSTTTDTTTAGTEQPVVDSMSLRVVPPAVTDELKKQPDFAYANDPDYWVKPKETRDPNFTDRMFRWLSSAWMRWFWYILLGSILLFALYKIVVENRLYLFYASSGKKQDEQDISPGLPGENLDQRIATAEAAGDWRAAIRFRYLKALKTADEKKWIHFEARASNEDYLREMAHHPQEQNFRLLTRVYEYVWYGDFVVTAEQFDTTRRHFEDFYQYTHH
ncbi:MAG TPA: DUF4129 domain-containing protein [Puia sp.]|nr:DUF4129 domain-containing protein [Puia sp.]